MAMQYDFNVLIEKLKRGTLTAVEARALNQAAKNNPELASVIRSYARNAGATGGATRQTLGVPGVGNLNHRNGGGYSSGHTISPGGFKKSGQDEASYARMRGKLTPDAVLANVTETVRKNRFGKTEKDGGLAFNGRNYSPSQIEWIKKRALTGATLSNAQQAIYDSVMSRERQAQEDAVAKNANEQAAKNAQREWEQKLALAKQKSDLALANQQANIRLRAELQAKNDEAKRAAKDAERKAKLQRLGLPEDGVFSDKDINDVGAGRKRWGYSTKDQKLFDEYEAEIQRLKHDPDMKIGDIADHTRQLRAQQALLEKRLVDKPLDQRTAEEIYNGAAIIGGQRYVTDGKGGLTLIKNPAQDRADAEAQRRADREERESARLQERKDRWIDSRAEKYAKEKIKDADTGDETPRYSYEEALKMAMTDAGVRFKDETPPPPSSDPATAQGQPQSPEVTCPACGSTNIGADNICNACRFNLTTNQYERQPEPTADQTPEATASDWTASFGATRIAN